MSSTIYKGHTWKRRLTVTNAKDGSPYDITGAAISFRGKFRTSDAVAVIDFSVGSGITILAQSGATLGQADILLPGTDSAGFAVDSLICAAVVTLTDDVEPKIVLPPFRVSIRELP